MKISELPELQEPSGSFVAVSKDAASYKVLADVFGGNIDALAQTDGHVVLGDILINWGYVGGTGNQSATFTRPFSATFGVVASCISSSTAISRIATISALTLTSVSLRKATDANSVSAVAAFYVAIGLNS